MTIGVTEFHFFTLSIFYNIIYYSLFYSFVIVDPIFHLLTISNTMQNNP